MDSSLLAEDLQSPTSTAFGHAGKNLVELFMHSSWAEFNPSNRRLVNFLRS
jgi:hypothetical protein